MTAEEEVSELMAVIASGPLVNLQAYRRQRHRLLDLRTRWAEGVLREVVEPHRYSEESRAPYDPGWPQPPRLVWANEQARRLRVKNAELLDAEFGRWTLQGITAPSTGRHPC